MSCLETCIVLFHEQFTVCNILVYFFNNLYLKEVAYCNIKVYPQLKFLLLTALHPSQISQNNWVMTYGRSSYFFTSFNIQI